MRIQAGPMLFFSYNYGQIKTQASTWGKWASLTLLVVSVAPTLSIKTDRLVWMAQKSTSRSWLWKSASERWTWRRSTRPSEAQSWPKSSKTRSRVTLRQPWLQTCRRQPHAVSIPWTRSDMVIESKNSRKMGCRGRTLAAKDRLCSRENLCSRDRMGTWNR